MANQRCFDSHRDERSTQKLQVWKPIKAWFPKKPCLDARMRDWPFYCYFSLLGWPVSTIMSVYQCGLSVISVNVVWLQRIIFKPQVNSWWYQQLNTERKTLTQTWAFIPTFIPLSLWLCFVCVALMWLNHVGQVTDILPEQKSAVTFIDPQKGSHLGVVVHCCAVPCCAMPCCAVPCRAVLCCARQDKSSGTAAQTELLLGDSVGQTCTWGSAQKTQLWGRLTLPCTLAERSQYYHCTALTLSPPISSPLSAPAFSSLSHTCTSTVPLFLLLCSASSPATQITIRRPWAEEKSGLLLLAVFHPNQLWQIPITLFTCVKAEADVS